MLGPAPWHGGAGSKCFAFAFANQNARVAPLRSINLGKIRVTGTQEIPQQWCRSAMRGYTGCPVGDAQNLGFARRIALNQYGESTLHRGIVRIVGTFRICCVKALIADRHKFCVPLGTTMAKNCDGTHIQFLTQLDNAGREVHRLQTEAKQ